MEKSFFESKRWKVIMNYVYGLGAAIVIAGALFKIMHWKGADLMLIVGMGTECVIFVISSFEPIHMDPDWSLVYPELAGDESADGGKKKGTITQQLDTMLKEANVDSNVISSLGSGLQSLSSNVKEMASLSNASVATKEYAESASAAANNMNAISNSSAEVANSMGSLSGGLSNFVNNLSASENETVKFKEEIAKLNSNLASLNTVYGNMLSAMGGGR
ncbi:MAG: gliding motility protein GldL [Sphingomonadales bacterium]|nr:gliding motility protein GldL [Sphingomonadales bacterium]